jgi:hypothetical protein
LPCQGRSGQGRRQRARSWCSRTPGLPASSSHGAENNGARQQRGRPRRWWWITPAHLALAQPGVTVAALISPPPEREGAMSRQHPPQGLPSHLNSPPSLSPLFVGLKYRKPKMASHDLRARSFEEGCLCSILHGLLQLQTWTAFLLPARLFPTVARQSATQLSHTTFSQLSEPTQGSSSTCTLLFPFPTRFSALHCRSPSYKL